MIQMKIGMRDHTRAMKMVMLRHIEEAGRFEARESDDEFTRAQEAEELRRLWTVRQ